MSSSLALRKSLVTPVFAIGTNGEFGYRNKLPWPRLSKDLEHFWNTIRSNGYHDDKKVVIMGRKTFESLPNRMKPIPGVMNFVISSNNQLDSKYPGIRVFSDLQSVFNLIDYFEASVKIYLIGGCGLIEEFYQYHSDRCLLSIITEIEGDFKSDVFFNTEYIKDMKLLLSKGSYEDNGIKYSICYYIYPEKPTLIKMTL